MVPHQYPGGRHKHHQCPSATPVSPYPYPSSAPTVPCWHPNDTLAVPQWYPSTTWYPSSASGVPTAAVPLQNPSHTHLPSYSVPWQCRSLPQWCPGGTLWVSPVLPTDITLLPEPACCAVLALAAPLLHSVWRCFPAITH